MAAVNVRGVDLECTVTGEGRPLIWGHGLSSGIASEDQFSVVDSRRLAELCQVVRYDARGHGLSTSTPVSSRPRRSPIFRHLTRSPRCTCRPWCWPGPATRGIR